MRSSIQDSTHALNMEASEVILGGLYHYWPHNLQLDEVYFNCTTIINSSIEVSGARMPFHNLCHNLCNATMACCLQVFYRWSDRIKNIIEKVQRHSLSLSLSLSCIYKKYSICTGSIINMCIITYTSTYLCIVMLLYFITFCTSINNVLHMQKKT